MLSKISITEAFAKIPDLEHPHVVVDVNEFQVKLSKLKWEFVWHSHEEEDELFLVVRGQLKMKLRGGEVLLNEGEMICVPHGVEHCPESEEEVHVILFERATTVNTGGVRNEKTKQASRL
jgi:mannose-6-phosphate isomerase-like protein (cupin superfamily)